jgi:hypothetical protein
MGDSQINDDNDDEDHRGLFVFPQTDFCDIPPLTSRRAGILPDAVLHPVSGNPMGTFLKKTPDDPGIIQVHRQGGLILS